MIKAVVFDFAGVVAPGPLTAWVKENIPDDDERHELYKEWSRKWDLGEVSLEQFYKIISTITGIEPHRIWDELYATSLLNEGVITIIKQLKPHYKVALLSDNFGEILRKLLEHHNITNLFDDILISSEHKVKKPDPKSFTIMLENIGISKEEVIFIDDKKENVDAALRLGIKALLFTNAEILKQELKQHGIVLAA